MQDNDLAKIKNGRWFVAYEFKDAQTLTSLSELKAKLKEVNTPLSWPSFYVPKSKEIEPIPYNNEGLECWHAAKTHHSLLRGPSAADFWIYTKEGKAFITSGFREDEDDLRQKTKLFILSTPILKLTDCLIHAQKMAILFGCPNTQIKFKFSWKDLEGRTLVYWKDHNQLDFIEERPVCSVNNFHNEFSISASDIESLLPEIIYNQLFPLYENFNLYRVPKDFVIDEVSKIKKGFR